MSQTDRLLKKYAGNVLMLLVFSALALVGMEAAYRVYLENKLPEMMGVSFEEDASPSFWFYADPPPWVFNKSVGFNFSDGPWLVGEILEGAFNRCNSQQYGNKYGNFGKVVGDYTRSDIKILLIGSSYTLVNDGNGGLVTHILEKSLSDKLHKSVSILNYSRDSTGVLRFFDIARSKIEEMTPDLVLFVFNTGALGLQRYWRALAPVQDGYWRLAATLEPDDTLTNKDMVALHTQIITDRVTRKWCEELARARDEGDTDRLKTDPVVRELIVAHDLVRRETTIPQVAVDFWALSRSFVYNRLVHGNAYYKIQVFKERTAHGPLGINSYAEDPQFVEAVDFVRSSGVPFLLAHVPTLQEMQGDSTGGPIYGMGGVPEDREKGLVLSLQDLTRRKLIYLWDFYDPAVKEKPIELVTSEQNSHPKPTSGVAAMAVALEKLLLTRPDTRVALGLSREIVGAE